MRKKLRALIDGILEEYQQKGATNMLVDSEVITTPSGLPALRIFGTLDLVKIPMAPAYGIIFLLCCLILTKARSH